MLKKLNGVLNILIISLIGAFTGHVIYVCLDYRTHPKGLCYAVGAMVYRYFVLWHIYDCPKLILCRKLKQQK